jgi:hypothetical protein
MNGQTFPDSKYLPCGVRELLSQQMQRGAGEINAALNGPAGIVSAFQTLLEVVFTLGERVEQLEAKVK